MALKPVKDFASFLTAEGSKPVEVLGQLLGAAGQDMLGDLPVTTVDAIIATGLDPTATSQVRTLAYQVLSSGQATAYSERFLERVVPIVTLDLANEDRELAMLALASLFAMVKDPQLVPLLRDPPFVDGLKTALVLPDSPMVRQTVAETLGRLLPRLMARLELPTVLSGTFPSMVDAQRFRQEARDAAADLVKLLWDGCEDSDHGVSASCFVALEEILATGRPRLLQGELASFFNTPEKPPPTCVMQELCVSYFRVGAPRLPRLLQRFTHLPKGLRRGAIGALSSLISYALLDATNIHALYLARPPGSEPPRARSVTGATQPVQCSLRQTAHEWLHVHLLALAQGTEAGEAHAAATWAIEMLHLPPLRVYRKNLAHLLVESLLRLPSLVQLRASRPFLRSLSDAQASMVVYGVVALKWLSLSVLEATLPRVLQAVRWIEHDACRASCLGEVVALLLCDATRNGRIQDTWVLRSLLGHEWVRSWLGDEACGQFREELVTAILLTLLRLAPIVFLPVGLQVKLGESSSSKAPHDLSYYARLSTVTRLTRKAVSKPNTSNTNPKDMPRSASDAVLEPFWVQNCGRWVASTLVVLERAAGCAGWGAVGTAASSPFSAFAVYVSLLSLTCGVLLSPRLAPRLADVRNQELDRHRDALKSVLSDLLSFSVGELSSRSLRLKLLRILSQHVAAMDNPQPTATALLPLLTKELGNQEEEHRWLEDLASRRQRGQLGGGRASERPSGMAQSLWRARVALHCMMQVALNVKAVAPSVLSSLEAAIANVDESQGADVWFFRQEVQATQATIQACLSPSPGPGHTRTPTPTNQHTRSASQPLVGAPLAEVGEDVLLLEPLLLPGMEADGRVNYRHDRAYQYHMKVYSALSGRLNRLLKTATTFDDHQGQPASSLFKRLHATLPEAVSGGSDPIHVTLRHSLPPHTNVLLIAARAYNATNCRIDRMQIQLVVVDGRAARLGSGQRHVADYSGSLEPGGCFEAHFHLDVLRFGDVQVAVDVVFPGVEVEVETEGDDIDEDETEGATASTQGHQTAGSPGGMDGPQPCRNVSLRTQPCTVPFTRFLCPAMDYELLLPSFQEIWGCLTYAQSTPVATLPSLVRAVQLTLPPGQTRQHGEGEDIIRLMEAATSSGDGLLSGDTHAASLRERARVTNRVRRVPTVAGAFFSEAWLFRTWSGHTLAAVLSGTSLPGMQWTGRLELRCNDQETFDRCALDAEALGRMLKFLTNGLFVVGDRAIDAFELRPSPYPVGGGLSTTLGPAAVLPRWQKLAEQRKRLGLT